MIENIEYQLHDDFEQNMWYYKNEEALGVFITEEITSLVSEKLIGTNLQVCQIGQQSGEFPPFIIRIVEESLYETD